MSDRPIGSVRGAKGTSRRLLDATVSCLCLAQHARVMIPEHPSHAGLTIEVGHPDPAPATNFKNQRAGERELFSLKEKKYHREGERLSLETSVAPSSLQSLQRILWIPGTLSRASGDTKIAG